MCRRLHALAADKHVWLALIHDLKARLFLDLPPGTNLDELSTSALVSLAQRAIHGPRTWSQGRANGRPPTVLRTHRVHPRIPVGQGILFWENEAKLLPGGRYVLFCNWRSLECWDVIHDRLIWTHESALSRDNSPHVLKFAADVVDDGKALLIVVCVRTYKPLRRREKCVSFSYFSLSAWWVTDAKWF
jgi:hypothetical protein